MLGKWSEHETLKFLDLYKKYECLWDYQNEYYNNAVVRNNFLETFIKEMGIPGLTVIDIKNKIKGIRTMYSRERIILEQLKLDGGDIYKRPNLYWFQKADSFLHKVMVFKGIKKHKKVVEKKDCEIEPLFDTGDTQDMIDKDPLQILVTEPTPEKTPELLASKNCEDTAKLPVTKPNHETIPEFPKNKNCENPIKVLIPKSKHETSEFLASKNCENRVKFPVTEPTHETITDFQSNENCKKMMKIPVTNLKRKAIPELQVNKNCEAPVKSPITMPSRVAIPELQTRHDYKRDLASIMKKMPQIVASNNENNEVESKKIKVYDDEFDVFGKLVAIQLKGLPTNKALLCQDRILSVIRKERMQLFDLSSKPNVSSSCQDNSKSESSIKESSYRTFEDHNYFSSVKKSSSDIISKSLSAAFK